MTVRLRRRWWAGALGLQMLVAACGGLLPEGVLARVDAVAVLAPFDREGLLELAARRGVTEGAEALVELALKSPAPARELCALVARL